MIESKRIRSDNEALKFIQESQNIKKRSTALYFHFAKVSVSEPEIHDLLMAITKDEASHATEFGTAVGWLHLTQEETRVNLSKAPKIYSFIDEKLAVDYADTTELLRVATLLELKMEEVFSSVVGTFSNEKCNDLFLRILLGDNKHYDALNTAYKRLAESKQSYVGG